MYIIAVVRFDQKQFFIEVPDLDDLHCWVISNIGTLLSFEQAYELKNIVSKDNCFIKIEIFGFVIN